MAGINRARKNELIKYSSIKETAGDESNKPCVFISYHHSDKAVAEKIANYLTQILDLDIYFDDSDQVLKNAIDMNDDAVVTKAINNGIESSSDILCIVSNKTNESWWVPYELGYAKKKNVGIASLKIKGESDFPSYLKIEKTITHFSDFQEYYKKIRTKYSELINENINLFLEINLTFAVKGLLY